MKTLDDAVIELNGVLPKHISDDYEAGELYVNSRFELIESTGVGVGGRFISSGEKFNQRAKELGFVGRYRWGVEYKTDGKRPELDDDVRVVVNSHNKGHFLDERAVSSNMWQLTHLFKITDQRYKPADTSYLDKPGSSKDNGADWYDYDNQKALRLPPIGAECLVEYDTPANQWFIGQVYFHNDDAIVGRWLQGPRDGELFDYYLPEYSFRPLDYDRKAKAKAERKRVVDAAFDSCVQNGCNSFGQWLEHLYDKGFLRLPGDSK